MISLGLMGYGHWGQNLARNFHALGALKAIADPDSQHREAANEKYPNCEITAEGKEWMDRTDISAVALATPAATHFELARAFLEAGKDVFVEKPVALTLDDADALQHLIEKNHNILMVDHLLQYHPAVLQLKDIVDNGKLGKVHYIYSNRLNIGRLRSEENILWSFAPHDISVILMLLEKEPEAIHAFGEAYLQEGIFDTTVTTLAFPGKVKAHVYVSWLHPYKEQRLVVIGSEGMAVFNDQSEEKLLFYPHKIAWIKQVPVASKADKEVIPFPQQEPLGQACRHFCECCESRQTPRTDIQEARKVLRVLTEAEAQLKTVESIP